MFGGSSSFPDRSGCYGHGHLKGLVQPVRFICSKLENLANLLRYSNFRFWIPYHCQGNNGNTFLYVKIDEGLGVVLQDLGPIFTSLAVTVIRI